MSAFTYETEYSTNFDGDEVVYAVTRPTYGHLAHLLPIINIDDEGNVAVSNEDVTGLIMSNPELLTENVTLISPPVDSNGKPLDFETLLKYSYFGSLLSEMLGNILRSSMPTSVQEKNSDGPPATQ